MKKLIAFSLCAVMALSLSVSAFAVESPMLVSPGPAVEEPQTGYALHIDGEDTGVRACIMVPLRAVAEKLGFEVVWNGDNTITVTGDALYANLTIGEDRYFTAPTQEGLMGASLFSLGMAPYAVNGVTYVPLGLFDALLGSQQGAVTMADGVICLDTDPLGKMGGVQMPNPFAEYETLAEAAQAAGVELTAPETVNGSDGRVFRAMENDLLEVIYRKGEDETARVRKAAGTEDISGDYNVYAQVDTVTVNGAQVTLKGEAGKVSLATWTAEGYTYSVSAEGGISSSDMIRLVANVH